MPYGVTNLKLLMQTLLWFASIYLATLFGRYNLYAKQKAKAIKRIVGVEFWRSNWTMCAIWCCLQFTCRFRCAEIHLVLLRCHDKRYGVCDVRECSSICVAINWTESHRTFQHVGTNLNSTKSKKSFFFSHEFRFSTSTIDRQWLDLLFRIRNRFDEMCMWCVAYTNRWIRNHCFSAKLDFLILFCRATMD